MDKFNTLRLDTLGAINYGVLNREAPDDIAPPNISWVDISCDWDMPSENKIRRLLTSGKGLDGNGYYGLPRAWREGRNKYAIDCMQYHQRTVEIHNLTLNEAVEKFCEIASECQG